MKKILAIVACLLVFFSFITAAIVVYKPLNEEQYQILEKVVYDAYTNEDFLMEVPDGVHLTKSETEIRADFSRLPTSMTYGYVEGKLINNKFTVTRFDETVDTVLLIFVISLCLTWICVLLFGCVWFVLHAALLIATDNEDDIYVNLSGVKNLKQFFASFKEWFDFKKLLAILIVVILFVGNFAFYMHITRPFNEDEWKQAEIFAQNVYNSNGSLIEIPEAFDVSIDDYSITVSDNQEWSKGFSTVIATVKNGNLVFSRDNGIAYQLLISIFCGIATPFVILLIIVLSCCIYEEWLKPQIAKLKKNIQEKRSIQRAEKIKRNTKKNRLK